MTGSTFKIHVVITISLLLLGTGALIILSITLGDGYAENLRAGIPTLVAASAGWITYCLQRRVSYINALRDLWENVVEVVQETFQYTYKAPPQESDFTNIMGKLSRRIDDVRGVFMNVDERYVPPSPTSKQYVVSLKRSNSIEDLQSINSDFRLDRRHIGVYPFESLKQIRGVVKKLGYGEMVTAEKAATARLAISNLWKITRYELSKELDRDYPAFPDTPYDPGLKFWHKVRRAVGVSSRRTTSRRPKVEIRTNPPSITDI